MPLGDPYINRAELKSYMGLETSEKDDLVDYAIESAFEEIFTYTHRDFNDAGSATARVFKPNDHGLCIVDDFHTTAGLIIQTDDDDDGVFETTWTTADYELAPLNAPTAHVPARPYFMIYAVGTSLRFHSQKRASVKVTARWGWAAVPAPVRQSHFILASDTFQLKDSRLGLAGSDQFGQIIRVRDNQMVEKKLKGFRRKGVLIA